MSQLIDVILSDRLSQLILIDIIIIDRVSQQGLCINEMIKESKKMF